MLVVLGHARWLYASLCEQMKARVLAGSAEDGGGMFALAERRHKWNIQGKYHPDFCKAEMASLQHLSQQFPNSVFGSPETHGSSSWSHVWSQHSALQQASSAFDLQYGGGWE